MPSDFALASATSPLGGALPLRRHVAETVRLALPMIGSRAGMILMITIDTVVTGWSGPDQLAFFAVGIAPQITLMLVALGALQSTAVLTAQAIGAGHPAGAGAVLRAALFHALVLGVVIGTASAFSEPFFRAVGQTPEIAAGAAAVSRAYAYGLPGLLLYVTAAMFLEATGRPRVALVVILVADLVKIPLNLVLVLGWGGLVAPMGAAGAVLGSSAVRWLCFVAVAWVIWAHRADRLRLGLDVPLRTWLAEAVRFGGAVGGKLRRLGLPMGIAQGVESSAFTAVVFIAGALGEVAAAAHQTTMTLLVLVYMSAIGFGGAATIRTGIAVGRGSQPDVRRAGLVALGLAIIAAVPVGIAFHLAPETVAGFVTQDASVLTIARDMLLVAGWFVAVDATNGVLLGALRGTGDVWLPLFGQGAAFWCVAVPAAYAATHVLGFGPVGLFYGIAAGMMTSLAILLPRFLAVSSRPLHSL